MTPHSRYTPWLRRTHWLIAIAVILALVLIQTKGWLPRGSALRETIKWAHMQFGMAAFALMLPRLLIRLRSHTPPTVPKPPSWMAWPAKTVQLALYVLLLAVPLLGMVMMAISGKPWNFLGIPLPGVTSPNGDLARDIKGIHETLGELLMWLAIVHIAAAVFHHVIRSDDTLRRMLPLWRREST